MKWFWSDFIVVGFFAALMIYRELWERGQKKRDLERMRKRLRERAHMVDQTLRKH